MCFLVRKEEYESDQTCCLLMLFVCILGLIAEDVCRSDAFLWHSNLHHDMNITQLISSSYEGGSVTKTLGSRLLSTC